MQYASTIRSIPHDLCCYYSYPLLLKRMRKKPERAKMSLKENVTYCAKIYPYQTRSNEKQKEKKWVKFLTMNRMMGNGGYTTHYKTPRTKREEKKGHHEPAAG